jgi:hypothetical protein
MDQKETLQKYANLKAQIKLLTAEMDGLKETVSEIVTELNPTDGIVETEFGTFTMVPKRKYEYSKYVQSLKKTLDEWTADEEATGVATYVINPYLLYKE